MFKKSFYLVSLALISASGVFAQSAYVPAEDELNTTLSYTYQTFDEFWMGSAKSGFPSGHQISQHTETVSFNYGVYDKFGLDLAVGYTSTDTDPVAELGSDQGFSDSQIGLTYQFANEYDYESGMVPSASIRIGGIMRGDYSTGYPGSPGDGGSGYETSLNLGKGFGETGFGVYGNIGYRFLNGDVPDSRLYNLGVYQTFLESWAVGFEYRDQETVNSNLNIGGPGFTPLGFPGLDEDKTDVQGSISYKAENGYAYSLVVAQTIDGRNAADSLACSLSMTLPFNLR